MTAPVCDPRWLIPVAYAGSGFTIWSYRSVALLSQMLAAGYFDSVPEGDLMLGDIIHVRARDAVAQIAVVAIKGRHVTVGCGWSVCLIREDV